MPARSIRKKRGTAEPRWGWSGPAQVIPPKLSPADIARVRATLPRRIPIRQIIVELRELGGRFHRRLHQDEFGPSRAESMAALRALADRFDVLTLSLSELPTPPRLWLCEQLAVTASPSVLLDMDDDFGVYANDEEALRRLAEIATAPSGKAYALLTGAETTAIANLGNAAEVAAVLFSNLDSTTSGTLIDEFRVRPLSVVWDEESNFTIARARIHRLKNRIEQALARLEGQRGPETSLSLRWLVWELCDLYLRETGQPVTSSAVVEYAYTAVPQSQAGRFVLACVEALQPSEAWINDPDHSVEKQRRRIFDQGARSRAVYFAMRDYVTQNRAVRTRRDRRRRGPVTL
jgi:hypothetical protein